MATEREPFGLVIMPMPENPPSQSWRWVIHERDYTEAEYVYAEGTAADYWDANNAAYAALPHWGAFRWK